MQHQDIADEGGAVFADIGIVFLAIDVVFLSPGGDAQPVFVDPGGRDIM